MKRQIKHVPSMLALAAFGAMGITKIHFAPDGGTSTDDTKVTNDTYKAMREESGRLFTEAQGVIDAATAAGRELTAEEKAANKTRLDRMNTIKESLTQREKFAAAAIEDGDDGDGKLQLGKEAPGKDQFAASEGKDGKKIDPAAFGEALTKWGATGEMDRKFATITSATASSALIPKDVAQPIVPTAGNAFREAHAILGIQPVSSVTTADLSLPVMSATAGGVVSETDSSENENPPTLSESMNLNVSNYESGSAWFSSKALRANDFDLLSFASESLYFSKELGLEAAIAAGIIADAGVTQAVTLALTTAFTYGELASLNRALPRRFDKLKAIFLGQAAFIAAEKLVGSDGHPILVQDPQNQDLKRFNGTPVLRCDNFEAFGASKVIGCVVSLFGFRLRDVNPSTLERYQNIPGRPGQSGFNLLQHHGFGYAPSAVAKLKTPAS